MPEQRSAVQAAAYQGAAEPAPAPLVGRPEVWGGIAALVITAGVVAGFLFGWPRIARSASPPPPGGYLAVDVPREVSPSLLQATVLQGTAVVTSRAGRVLSVVPAADLASEELSPGDYTIRLQYRGRALSEAQATVAANDGSLVALPRAELAGVEVETGVAQDQERRGAGRGHFTRALKLDPDNVEAHLWLALDAVTRRASKEAVEHLKAVKEIDPANAALPRVGRLIQRLKGARS
jgi:hypothetical protein